LTPIKAVRRDPCKGHRKACEGGFPMRLMMVLYSMIATALAGSGVVAVLTMGYGTLWPIVIAAAAGAVLALPVSWAIARQID
jgi:hypothetical protein